MKHLETHPVFVDGCYVCKISTVAVSAAATPTSRSDTVSKIDMEARWAQDIPAYRRLVKDGLNPKGVDGSAALEARANTPIEVERGHTMPQRVAERATRIEREAAHVGL